MATTIPSHIPYPLPGSHPYQPAAGWPLIVSFVCDKESGNIEYQNTWNIEFQFFSDEFTIIFNLNHSLICK